MGTHKVKCPAFERKNGVEFHDAEPKLTGVQFGFESWVIILGGGRWRTEGSESKAKAKGGPSH